MINMTLDKEITYNYIITHGIRVSNIIVQEEVPGEGHKVFLERLEPTEKIKIADNVNYVHLYGVRVTTNDILPICIIERGVIYITNYIFHQIVEREGGRDLKLYIPI